MKKVAIIYGSSKSDVQKRALEELSALCLDYTGEYPVCLPAGEEPDRELFRPIYVGTRGDNPGVRAASSGALTLPESYSIRVADDTVTIEGYDDAGVLYGVIDLYNKYLIQAEHTAIKGTNEDWDNPFSRERLPDFEYTSSPAVKERGLWSWGHVIYDYRGYLHSMMKLKMNGIVIWNDFVPTNARDIVEYAHSCNIKVYWGFDWLWDINAVPDFNVNDLSGESERIFRIYEEQYADAGGDGIYFQTFTERKVERIDGVLIAEAATKFVNGTAALFYAKYPELEIQFGLHATSVKDRLDFIREADPRIRIVWEDCGAFPFSYLPKDTDGFGETKDFVKRIACLRGNGDRFGVVTKGTVTLDWSRFEHLRGSQCIGVSSRSMRRERLARRARQWRYIQSGWICGADLASEMIRTMCKAKRGDLSVFGLVEDGMLEECIFYPVALYSELLWDRTGELKEIMKSVALREYVSFV